jgi:hypothetical protein
MTWLGVFSVFLSKKGGPPRKVPPVGWLLRLACPTSLPLETAACPTRFFLTRCPSLAAPRPANSTLSPQQTQVGRRWRRENAVLTCPL